ncbi:NUDIX hydrolase [Candidatus Halobonum tyrrellensis]|uniref:Mut/nudix family protein n=1 Tax=Candidatus Halobonum tyrrellensis G22 TaxID=1324957 RepID=V4HFT5_9EURY|nr:CoA pyrophosphatase [Candidatus Halobonum tyrrellensis]ESP88963.1 Mut/nudix family protein [Candidatus Halobonum tyrrellensis G22]
MNLDGVRRHAPATIGEAERRAAVLAPVVDRGGTPHVLFTKRADHLGSHPGQMSFPGGGVEAEDADLKATALREADEEIGLRPGEVEVVGRLDDVETVSDYVVTPFVGTVPDREYAPSDGEVAEIAVLPVAELTDRANYESARREHPRYGDVRIHFFRVGGYTVWGVTGGMVVQLLELATDWRMPDEVDRVVDPDADLPT